MQNAAEALRAVRQSAPLVQCITNFVTVNDCANLILAAGGSPTMAHVCGEVEEVIAGADALVCNLGAIEDVEAMVLAGRAANRLGKPVVLDPVAAGGTTLRRKAVQRLLAEVRFSVIRGNASEIRALAGEAASGSGVDVGGADVITAENLPQAVAMVRALARQTGAVIAVSGAIDVISDGERVALVENGCATMSRITGSGCMLTALIGAFCGAKDAECFAATCAAVAALGVAGERAEEKRLQNGTGNASFRIDLIDAVFCLTEEALSRAARITYL